MLDGQVFPNDGLSTSFEYKGKKCLKQKPCVHFALCIPIICRVRGLYGKLLIDVFSSCFPSAGHIDKEGKKQGSKTCGTNRANEANKMFIIWLC